VAAGMTGTMTVIVTSYNRPRMLREALATVGWARDIIIADDGSDFDVFGDVSDWLWEAMGRAARYVLAEKRTPDERMNIPSTSALINRAIRMVDTDYLTVLCDDDLLAPGWLQAAAAALDADPCLHMVRGDWGLFNDGEPPDPAKLCTFTFSPPLTAGNFVYRASCATVEGCWWLEDSLAVHDGPMLSRYIALHGNPSARPPWLGYLDMLAGYRREHPKTVSNNSLFGGDRYLPNTAALFAVPGGME